MHVRLEYALIMKIMNSPQYYFYETNFELEISFSSRNNLNQRALEGDPRTPKKATDKKFQIQNNLDPVIKSFVIDGNRFKQVSKQAKTVIETLKSDWNDRNRQYKVVYFKGTH